MSNCEVPEHKKQDYEIINNFGTQAKIWFFDAEHESQLLENQESLKIKYSKVKKIQSKIKPKNKFEVGKSFNHNISVKINGFDQISNLLIENSSYKTFELKNENESVICRKKVKILNNKKVIILSRDAVIINKSLISVDFYHENFKFSVLNKYFLALD